MSGKLCMDGRIGILAKRYIELRAVYSIFAAAAYKFTILICMKKEQIPVRNGRTCNVFLTRDTTEIETEWK